MWIDFLYGMILDKGDLVKARPYMNREVYELTLEEYDPEKMCWIAKSKADRKGEKESFLINDEMVVKVYRE